jgi:hypothetical protein
MVRLPWTDRKFEFDIPPGWIFNIRERLLGTEFRIVNLIRDYPEKSLMISINQKWSVKQEIGHLLDLEDLHILRIQDLCDNKTELRPADMSNEKTNSENHNGTPIEELISRFSTKRNKFISTMMALNDEQHLYKSLHPRLKKEMAAVDIAYFVAEHDDHHLTSIREVLSKIL